MQLVLTYYNLVCFVFTRGQCGQMPLIIKCYGKLYAYLLKEERGADKCNGLKLNLCTLPFAHVGLFACKEIKESNVNTIYLHINMFSMQKSHVFFSLR